MKQGIMAVAIIAFSGSVASASLYQEKSTVASPPLENTLQRLDTIEQRLERMDNLLRAINGNTLKFDADEATQSVDQARCIEPGMKADELERKARALKNR